MHGAINTQALKFNGTSMISVLVCNMHCLPTSSKQALRGHVHAVKPYTYENEPCKPITATFLALW